jgi:hypothetical protein
MPSNISAGLLSNNDQAHPQPLLDLEYYRSSSATYVQLDRSVCSSSSSIGRFVTLSNQDLELSIRPFKPLLTTAPAANLVHFLTALPPPCLPLLLVDLALQLYHLRSLLASLPALEAFFGKVKPSAKSHYLRNIATSLPPLVALQTLKLSHLYLTLLSFGALGSNPMHSIVFRSAVVLYAVLFLPHAAAAVQFGIPLAPNLITLLLPCMLLRLSYLMPRASFDAVLVSTLVLAVLIHVFTTTTGIVRTVASHPCLHATVGFCLYRASSPLLVWLLGSYIAAGAFYYIYLLISTRTADAKLGASGVSDGGSSITVLPHHRPLMCFYLLTLIALLSLLIFRRDDVVLVVFAGAVGANVVALLATTLNSAHAKALGAEPDETTWLGNHRIVPFVHPDELVFEKGVGWSGKEGGGRVWMPGIGYGMRNS